MVEMEETTGLTVSLLFLLVGVSKGGTVYGKMDKVGTNPVDGKFIDPASLNATIGYSMGLPLNDVQYSPSGRPFKVAHDGEPYSMFLLAFAKKQTVGRLHFSWPFVPCCKYTSSL